MWRTKELTLFWFENIAARLATQNALLLNFRSELLSQLLRYPPFVRVFKYLTTIYHHRIAPITITPCLQLLMAYNLRCSVDVCILSGGEELNL